MGPLEHKLATKFMQQNACGGVIETTPPSRAPGTTTQAVSVNVMQFQVADALLNGGQSKINTLVTPHCTNNSATSTTVGTVSMGRWAGLQLPQLKETGGAVRGNDKTRMRKENKCHRRHLKLEQTDTPQWTVHQG